MKLHTPSLYLTDAALTERQERHLLNSVNAMSAFAYDSSGMQSLPPSNYLAAYTKYSVFLGAVHMEQGPFSSIVSIHPMLLERNREAFAEVTEAAILWVINTDLYPTSQVLDTPEYNYMHNFLDSLGMLHVKDRGWRKYRLPHQWQPKSFSSYTFEWR